MNSVTRSKEMLFVLRTLCIQVLTREYETLRCLDALDTLGTVAFTRYILFIRYIYYWNIQFLNNVISNKINKDLLWFYCSQNYLAFQSFDFERTWWRLFQKRIVRTKFYIYVFITHSNVINLKRKVWRYQRGHQKPYI